MRSSFRSRGSSVFCIAIARIVDQVIVGAYAPKSAGDHFDEYVEAILRVLKTQQRSEILPEEKYRLISKDFTMYFVRSLHDLLYILITDDDVTPYKAYTALNNIVEDCRGDIESAAAVAPTMELSRRVAHFHHKHCDNLSMEDKVSESIAEEDTVSVATASTKIQKPAVVAVKLDSLDAVFAQQQARLFDKQAKTLRKREIWKSWQFLAGSAAAIVIIIIIIVVTVVKKT